MFGRVQLCPKVFPHHAEHLGMSQPQSLTFLHTLVLLLSFCNILNFCWMKDSVCEALTRMFHTCDFLGKSHPCSESQPLVGSFSSSAVSAALLCWFSSLLMILWYLHITANQEQDIMIMWGKELMWSVQWMKQKTDKTESNWSYIHGDRHILS